MKISNLLAGLLLILVIGGLLFYRHSTGNTGRLAGSASANGQISIKDIPAPDRMMSANYSVLGASMMWFIVMDGRAPANYAELASSVYMIVPAALIKNPFTGVPVKNSAEPSVGDINIHFNGEGSTIDNWIPKKDGTVGSGILNDDKSFRNAFGGVSNPKTLYGDTKDYVRSLTREEQHTYFVCQYLLDRATGSGSDQFDPGLRTSLGSLLQYHMFEGLTIVNPFTGKPMTEVSADNPSPGNITFYVVNHQGKPYYVYTSCYGAKSQPLSPAALDEYQRMLKMPDLPFPDEGQFRPPQLGEKPPGPFSSGH